MSKTSTAINIIDHMKGEGLLRRSPGVTEQRVKIQGDEDRFYYALNPSGLESDKVTCTNRT